LLSVSQPTQLNQLDPLKREVIAATSTSTIFGEGWKHTDEKYTGPSKCWVLSSKSEATPLTKLGRFRRYHSSACPNREKFVNSVLVDEELKRKLTEVDKTEFTPPHPHSKSLPPKICKNTNKTWSEIRS
jgi:hypothetical protein